MNAVTFGDVTVELKASDIKILESKEWLNESLIEFFMCKRARSSASKTGCEVAVLRAHWISVLRKRRWIAHVAGVPDHVNDAFQTNYLGAQHLHRDLFRNQLIFVPMNVHENHWILIVVYLAKNTVADADDPLWGRMFFFDSLPGTDSQEAYNECGRAIRGFLNCEWYFHSQVDKGKAGRVYDERTFPMHVMRMTRQRNRHDCGCYVIRACESFLAEIQHMIGRLDEGSVQWMNDLFKRKLNLGRNFRGKLREEVGIVNENDDGDDDESDGSDLVML